jgi:nitrile hydratase
MNGIHDMGGMHGMGRVPREPEATEPVFHEVWEGRVYALNRAIGAWRKWNVDTGRYYIERIAPADYLRMSYYEKWFTRTVVLLIQTGLVTREEVESGKPAPGSKKETPALTVARVPMTALNRGLPSSREPAIPPKFKKGERVRAINMQPAGHTRLPRYARGKVGEIDMDHGVHNFPDTNAAGAGPKRQHCYAVRFAARELWGAEASANDFVYLDLWDDYLERA